VQQARMLSRMLSRMSPLRFPRAFFDDDESFCHVDHVDPLQASEIVCV